MTLPRYEIFKDTKNEFRFRLLSVNGKIILQSSEGYTRIDDCERAVAICQLNSPDDNNYYRGGSGTNYYFTLRANNGEDIGISEMYTTVQNRDNGINAVKRDGSTEDAEDKS